MYTSKSVEQKKKKKKEKKKKKKKKEKKLLHAMTILYKKNGFFCICFK
jgi:hypothetical protein